MTAEGIVLRVVLTLGTAIFMEFVAAWVHEHVMHGWGWGWHKSHHEPHENAFEKNDLYALVGAAAAIAVFWYGAYWFWPLWWIGLGVTLYGVVYFFFHDGLVHQRWPFRHVPRRGYLKRVYQAHRLHHAVKGRDGCVSFGFVYTPTVDALVKQLDANRRRWDRTSLTDEGLPIQTR